MDVVIVVEVIFDVWIEDNWIILEVFFKWKIINCKLN